MKVDLSALWQTLTKRTAALLADEQKRTGLLVAVGLLGLVLLGVSSWLPAKSKPETTAPMPQSTKPACKRLSPILPGRARPV